MLNENGMFFDSFSVRVNLMKSFKNIVNKNLNMNYGVGFKHLTSKW